MKASVVDLRYKTKDVLRALERRETVTVLYHGKVKGTIVPPRSGCQTPRVADHPFFGIAARDRRPVTRLIDELRKGRFDDL